MWINVFPHKCLSKWSCLRDQGMTANFGGSIQGCYILQSLIRVFEVPVIKISFWELKWKLLWWKQWWVPNRKECVFRLAMVWSSSGLGTFWLNSNLDFKVWSGGLVNPNPEPHELGSRGSGSGLNLNPTQWPCIPILHPLPNLQSPCQPHLNPTTTVLHHAKSTCHLGQMKAHFCPLISQQQSIMWIHSPPTQIPINLATKHLMIHGCHEWMNGQVPNPLEDMLNVGKMLGNFFFNFQLIFSNFQLILFSLFLGQPLLSY